MRFRGVLYRALNPVWARQPLSGEGARRHGGRFNAKGVAALYTSASIMTAVREANQVGALQPTTLVSYDADMEPVFDANDSQALRRYRMTPESLAVDDWRADMRAYGKAPTQAFAERLFKDGYVGLRVRSFALGASTDDINFVFWTWGATRPALLVVNDRDGRLS